MLARFALVSLVAALAGCGNGAQHSSAEVDASHGQSAVAPQAARASLHAFASLTASRAARELLVRSADDAGRFELRAPRSTTFFSSSGLTFAVSAGEKAYALRATMVGASEVQPAAEEEQTARMVTQHGERPAFARVAWNELYPGVDMVAEPAPAGGTEYQFVLSPGAKVASIAMRWEGANKIEQVGGGVDVVTEFGALKIRGLHAFSIVDGERTELPARHVVRGDTLGFEVDGWDGKTELVIDPVVSWSSFEGGTGVDVARAVAVDGSGNVYVGGQTGASDFPHTIGTYTASNDIFITKLTPAGAVTWTAIYGGSSTDDLTDLAVDGAGNVYFVGTTGSTNFPVSGGFDTTVNGGGDALVGKLTSAGAIAWAGYLGGSASDVGRGIAVDASANVFVTGSTGGGGFPTTNGFQTTYAGSTDAFVTKISSAGAIVWSSYLGGSNFENYYNHNGGIGVDGSGGVFVAGMTQSSNFPVTSGAYSTSIPNSNAHGFLTKITDGTTPTVAWSTFVNGSATDEIYAIAVGGGGAVFLTGRTNSTNFPVTNGSTKKGSWDAFVTKFNGTGTLAWSTYYGGSGDENGYGIAVNAGPVFVTGMTTSTDVIPTAAFQATNGGGNDAFVARFTNAGVLEWSSFLGGSGNDQGDAIAADSTNNAYVAGETLSTNFPVSGAFDTTYNGQEGFVIRVRPAAIGTACTVATDCGGPCVDGFCCDTACAGACQACSAAKKGSGTNGTCGTIKVGTDPDSECAAASCTALPASATATPKQTCNGAGACTTTAATSCGLYLCNTTICATNCVADANCVNTAYCASPSCVAKKANGSACSAANQCSSSFCVDGVCCNSACGGKCQACTNAKTGGTTGTCANVKVATDPDSECAAASCTAGSATPKQTCNGAGACTTTAAAACSPYLCSGAACGTTCSSDANCATTAYCSGSTCKPKGANGAACTATNQCTSGNCVDGVCCNSVCTGACQACSAAKTGGTSGNCSSVKAGTDPDGECAAASCTSGMATPKQTCNGSGACTTTAAVSCGTFPCSGAVCGTTCTTDAGCASDAYCAGGVCTAKKANGGACTATNQCTSGFCVDGVCCDSACSGSCQACSATKKGSGANGTCGAINSGTDPDSECAAASCAAGVASPKQTCDGTGACTATTIACAPFACSGTACGTTCTTDGQCATGAYCAAGACATKLADGAACTATNQCQNGNCVDGVCCDTACTGACQACVASKTGGVSGTCAPVTSGTDPDSECAAASCSGGSAKPKESCDGTGSCTATTATACAPYACAGTACATTCTTTSDCASPNVCSSGACVSPVDPPDAGGDTGTVDTGVVDTGIVDTGAVIDTGSPSDKPTVTGGYGECKTPADCASGFCVDGVCCDRACDGTCESCTMPFAPGKCVPVPIGLDPKMQCSAIPCTRTCNGAGGCVTAFKGAQCASSRCTGPNTGAGPAICAAEGAACATDESIPFDCGAYACAKPIGACFQICASTDQCAPGFVCDTNSKNCVAAPGATDDGGGCSVNGAGSNSSSAGAIAALIGLVALAKTRRRTHGRTTTPG